MSYKKKLLASTIAFFVGGSVAQVGGAQDQVQEGDSGKSKFMLEEIVVTATKRETSLQETSESIAAIGSKELQSRNIFGMEDYLATVPGVSFLDQGIGQNNFVIRGVASDPEGEGLRTGPSVGLYFGEVPLAGLGALGGGANLRMVDIDRVEVLRGPQGTLFGAGSLAGAVRNIPNSPNFEETEGEIKLGYSNTSGTGADNNLAEATLNVPVIEDKFAVRAVIYRHEDSGYIKNTRASDEDYAAYLSSFGVTNISDKGNVGETEYKGARIAFGIRPIENLNINLQYVNQEGEQDGAPEAQISSGGYKQNRPSYRNLDFILPIKQKAVNTGSEEALEEDLEFTNLVVEYDFESVSLLSSTTWLEQENLLNRDISSFFGAPVIQSLDFSADYFVQEIRLVSDLEGPFQYILGAYYEDLDSGFDGYVFFGGDLPTNPFGGPLGNASDLIYDEVFETNLEQKAYFAELSYDITESLELTIGGRDYQYERERHLLQTGLFGDNLADGGAGGSFDASGSSYKANLAYQATDDQLIYFKWAEGFRPGNNNTLAPKTLCDVDDNNILDGTNVPIRDFFDSDTLESYELGIKSTMLENRLQVNASVYKNYWDGIPISVQSPTCLFSTVGNAGEAESTGIEVESIINITDSVQLFAGGSYIDAELTSDAKSLGGESGDRLPGSPDTTLNIGLRYDFELVGRSAYIRTDYAYIGGFYNNLSEQGVEAGDYGKLDFNAGISFDNFYVEFFGKNLTDEDSVTWAGTFLSSDTRVNRLRPRTLGFNVGYQF